MLNIANNAECKFAVHIKPKIKLKHDYHLVKEQIHKEDGTTEPRISVVKDYLRPFYVTKKGHQNHKEKKEYEHIDKLIRYDVTQNDLRDAVAKALGKAWSNDNLRRLSNSPFLYFTDISSTSLIKKDYAKANPSLKSNYSVAAFDIETDVIKDIDKKQIIMITVTMKDKLFTAVLLDFVDGHNDIDSKVTNAVNKYISEYVEKRKLKIEVKFYKSEGDVIQGCFDKIHEWKPDFLSIWNMDFDIPKVVDACERNGLNPEDVFSDPSLPKEFRFFEYKQGKKKKVTSSGKETPINPANQWHSVDTPASFTIIDAMCSYRYIRIADQEEPSYALDAILDKVLGIRKLKFKEADQYSGLEWHQFMQTNYKFEYIVYNMFDCISMLELDEVTTDLSVVLPMFSDMTDFARFNSQPKKLNDALCFYVLENKNLIFGTTGEMETELDKLTIPLSGIIVAFAAHLPVDNGIQCIAERPDLNTFVRIHMAD